MNETAAREDTADPKRQIARGAMQLSVAHACSMVCGYVVVVTLARGLGPDVYGVYGVIYSILLAAELAGRLGIPQALTKIIAESGDGSSRLEGTGLTLSLIVYTSIFGVFWLGAPWIAQLFDLSEGTTLLRIASLDIPLYGMYFMCMHILGGHRRFGIESVCLAIYSLTRAIGVLVLLRMGLSVHGALVLNVVASAVGLLAVATRLPRASFRLNLSFARPILALAVPLALFGIGNEVVTHLDLWCLKVFRDAAQEEAVGYYVAAVNVARIPKVISFVLMAVLIPNISRALADGRADLARSYTQSAVRTLILLLVPVCALAALRAEPLMVLLYSERYAAGAPFLAILVFKFGFFFTFLATFCAVFIGRGSARLAAGIMLFLIPLGWLANLLLISQAGPLGAAWAAVLTLAFGMVVAAWYTTRLVGNLLSGLVLLRVLLATGLILLLGACFPVGALWVVPQCAGLLGVYVLLLRLFGELTHKDVELFLPRRKGS